LVLHTTQWSRRSRVPGAAQREAKRNGALQTRDRRSLWRSRISDASLRFARAASHPGHAIASDAFGALFTFQTAQIFSFPRRVVAPGFCIVASPTRIEGWAEHRETFGCSAEHPWGVPSCVKDARERAYDAIRQALARRLASHDAGRSPLGAPPWRFWAPGAALPAPSAPAVLQRRAVALRIRAASSSHPGRSAWRAGSLPPEANGYEPPPRDATPRSAFRIVSGDAPQ